MAYRCEDCNKFAPLDVVSEVDVTASVADSGVDAVPEMTIEYEVRLCCAECSGELAQKVDQFDVASEFDGFGEEALAHHQTYVEEARETLRETRREERRKKREEKLAKKIEQRLAKGLPPETASALDREDESEDEDENDVEDDQDEFSPSWDLDESEAEAEEGSIDENEGKVHKRTGKPLKEKTTRAAVVRFNIELRCGCGCGASETAEHSISIPFNEFEEQ